MNNIKFILICLLIIGLIIFVYYFRSINKIKNVIQKPIINTSKKIVEIKSDIGFKIHSPDSKNVKEYKWSDFDTLILRNQEAIVFKSKSDNILELHKSEINNWIEVILSIPEKMDMNQLLTDKKNKIREKLNTCQICGRKALYDDTCLNCGNPNMEKFLSKNNKFQDSTEYLKQNQDYWFRQKNGVIDLNFDEPNVFERDEKWSLLIK